MQQKLKFPIVLFHLSFLTRRDTLVPPEWGQTTFDELAKLGVRGQFVPHRSAMHEIKKDQLLQVIKWANELIPEPKEPSPSPSPSPPPATTKKTAPAKRGKL